MSNLTILNVSRPNFSCEFRPTPFFFQFYYKTIILLKLPNLLLKNNFYHQKVHKKRHIKRYYGYPVFFKRFLSYCCFKMGKSPKMAQISWALVWKYVFKRSKLKKNFENQSNHNKVLYVVFYYLFNDTNGFCQK